MLNQSLLMVKQKLEQYLTNNFALQESIVVLNQLVEPDGSEPQKNQNKMVITLINLVEEKIKQYNGEHNKSVARSVVKVNPPQHFNMYLLFTANFDDYEEALKFLTATIGYFQANNVLEGMVHNELGEQQTINNLKFEIEDANYHQLHSLWNAMGAKYRPSMMYLVRYITIQRNQVKTITPQIHDVGSQMDIE